MPMGYVRQGILCAMCGDAEEGTRLLRSGLALLRQSSYYVFYPYFLGELAEILAARGQTDQALCEIDSALEMRCPWYRPEALRIKGRLLVSSDAHEAERLLCSSLAEAQRQGALSWELRSATNLAGLWRDQGSGPRCTRPLGTHLWPLHGKGSRLPT